jgi:hypothetical protein
MAEAPHPEYNKTLFHDKGNHSPTEHDRRTDNPFPGSLETVYHRDNLFFIPVHPRPSPLSPSKPTMGAAARTVHFVRHHPSFVSTGMNGMDGDELE